MEPLTIVDETIASGTVVGHLPRKDQDQCGTDVRPGVLLRITSQAGDTRRTKWHAEEHFSLPHPPCAERRQPTPKTQHPIPVRRFVCLGPSSRLLVASRLQHVANIMRTEDRGAAC